MPARVRILEAGSVNITTVLYNERKTRRKEVCITGPSGSSSWGIQKGKEIAATMKTGRKHQNRTKQQKKKKKKRSGKYTENQTG